MQKGKILALDYGMASIGLAVSDEDRLMAFGRGVIREKQHEKILEKIYELVTAEKVSLILFGLPFGKDGGETPQTGKIRRFAESVRTFLQEQGQEVVMDFIDESFSTYEANKILQQLGVEPRNRKSTEDEMAAVILIHRYIDFRP
jgi:putative Holliday junction resolvase